MNVEEVLYLIKVTDGIFNIVFIVRGLIAILPDYSTFGGATIIEPIKLFRERERERVENLVNSTSASSCELLCTVTLFCSLADKFWKAVLLVERESRTGGQLNVMAWSSGTKKCEGGKDLGREATTAPYIVKRPAKDSLKWKNGIISVSLALYTNDMGTSKRLGTRSDLEEEHIIEKGKAF